MIFFFCLFPLTGSGTSAMAGPETELEEVTPFIVCI